MNLAHQRHQRPRPNRGRPQLGCRTRPPPSSSHAAPNNGYFNPAVTTAIRTIERRLARRTDALLAVGSQVRDELLAAGIGDPERYTVVPPGVLPPVEWQRADARESFGIEPSRPVIAFVGRLAGVKRPDRLVEVVERVARERPDAVVLVGGGADPDELAALQAEVRHADVRWLGWVADVGLVYSAADLVLLTSDNEGMPVSLIEAGMCGRASVATDVGSVREVVLDGRTGTVVPTEAPALAAACLDLLDDPARREAYGDAAREHTHASFSMERLVETTQQVYERVLAG